MANEDKWEHFRPDWDKCLAFGFRQTGKDLTYQKALAKGDLMLKLRLSPDGQLAVMVWDEGLEESYEAWRVVTPINAFAQEVKEAVRENLQTVRKHCFREIPLTSPQGQRLFAWVQEKFADPWDHPFSRQPDATAFRLPQTKKWYGLVMTVAKQKLVPAEPATDKEMVEVINIKAPSGSVNDLTKQVGIYPAYHMSKKHWLTITLDDTVSDETLHYLCEQSRHLVLGKNKK
ncbi:MmcQ/YjbR family DNA-binding protein [Streptococcus sp. DD12]|uniref:MmcQ/YjbR family DNA-binding protein n=1 Tax=Streptococcus sp. DD12 TaxID=1777880 RepID=UPI00079521CB|nr:MmcQ/YjbR family DNA-binding protein [Streptococcus sp. DD12]KXT76167.1 hypothetical protein STRDD12_00663 [Streptococcus sp. DD12]